MNPTSCPKELIPKMTSIGVQMCHLTDLVIAVFVFLSLHLLLMLLYVRNFVHFNYYQGSQPIGMNFCLCLEFQALKHP